MNCLIQTLVLSHNLTNRPAVMHPKPSRAHNLGNLLVAISNLGYFRTANNPANVEILRFYAIITTHKPNHVVDFLADTDTTAL